MQNQETFDKLKFILDEDKKEETLNDKLYKYQLKILFGVDDNTIFYISLTRPYIPKFFFIIFA